MTIMKLRPLDPLRRWWLTPPAASLATSSIVKVLGIGGIGLCAFVYLIITGDAGAVIGAIGALLLIAVGLRGFFGSRRLDALESREPTRRRP
jgi:hypothetical protein